MQFNIDGINVTLSDRKLLMQDTEEDFLTHIHEDDATVIFDAITTLSNAEDYQAIYLSGWCVEKGWKTNVTEEE